MTKVNTPLYSRWLQPLLPFSCPRAEYKLTWHAARWMFHSWPLMWKIILRKFKIIYSLVGGGLYWIPAVCPSVYQFICRQHGFRSITLVCFVTTISKDRSVYASKLAPLYIDFFILWSCSIGHECLEKTLIVVWQFIIMSKNLNVVAQSHNDRNHISGQIWQTAIVMLMFFISNVICTMQNNCLCCLLDIYHK